MQISTANTMTTNSVHDVKICVCNSTLKFEDPWNGDDFIDYLIYAGGRWSKSLCAELCLTRQVGLFREGDSSYE